jgi:DNA-binding phage protein
MSRRVLTFSPNLPVEIDMALKTTPFDAAEYITSEEDRADLLNDALSTNDQRVIDHALQVIERSRTMDHATFSSTMDVEQPK